jgi:hypothetical protein
MPREGYQTERARTALRGLIIRRSQVRVLPAPRALLLVNTGLYETAFIADRSLVPSVSRAAWSLSLKEAERFIADLGAVRRVPSGDVTLGPASSTTSPLRIMPTYSGRTSVWR